MDSLNGVSDFPGVVNNSREALEDSVDECEDHDDEDTPIDPAEIVEEFETSLHEKGFEVVREYYDVIDHIFRKTYSVRGWHHRLSVLESLLKALDSLQINLTKFLSRSMNMEGFCKEQDSESASYFSDLLVMTTELIGFILGICEDDFNYRFYASVASLTECSDSCSAERTTEQSDLEDIDENVLQCYEILRRKALEAIHSICTFSLVGAGEALMQNAVRFLWHPAKADEEFLCIAASAVIKIMESPKFCVKSAWLNFELRELFLIVRSICTSYDFDKAAARMLVSATLEKNFRERQKTMQKYPFVEALLSVSKNGDLDHLLYYLYYFGMDSLHHWIQSQLTNVHIPNGYQLFIGAMAEHASTIMAENIAPLIPLLDFDPSALRIGILSSFCSVLISKMEKKRFSVSKSSMTTVRERMMDTIQEHLGDSAVQVRTKVIGFCVEIAHHKRIPEISLRKGLLSDVAERLTENSGVIRRAAIRFFKVFLVNNPYEKNLSRSYLLSQLELAHNFSLSHDDRLQDTARKFFNSIAPRLNKVLEEHIEKCSPPICSDPELEDTPLEKEKSKTELVASLSAELRARFLNVSREIIGVCDENANVVHNSQTDTLEEFDLCTEWRRNLEDAVCLHDQICKLLPEVIDSISVKDPADVSETVDFLVECCRFSIRGSEVALLKLYRKVECVSDVSKATVINGIASLFVIRKKDGKVDIEKTTKSLLMRLKGVDECGSYAVENLISVLVQKHAYPARISYVLFHVIEEDVEDRVLAMKALSALAISNATSMRRHLREFQKYVRDSNTVLACEALRALSYLFPAIPSNTTVEESENYRLRAFDSMFADVEKLLFKLFLYDDDSDAAVHWYNGVRNAIHLVFALSSEVDFVISRIAGKAIWYAKRTADVLLAYAAYQGEKETSVTFRKRRKYLCKKWQRTIESTLMLFGQIVEGVIVHINGSYPHELKRIAGLNEILQQNSADPEKDYGNFNENRSELEIDFAYEKGIFNLRPSRDEDIEIVAAILQNEKAPVLKMEHSSEFETNDALVQQNSEDTASTPNDEKLPENPTTLDDLIRTHLNKLMDSSLLKPYTSLGICLTFVVSCMRNSKYPKPIRDAAVRTFSVFLLISPGIAERGAPFLFAILCSDPDPHMREYLLTSAVDLLHRFPSMMESCALFLYRMASDEDISVRLTTVLWLTRLLCNDMIKPRGSLSDVALCMITRGSREVYHPSEKELIAAAKKLFKELSKKGNLLLNVLPDIVCRLARYGREVPMAEFQTLVRRLLEMVGDKPHDVIVEKMCQRFDICSSEEAISDNQKIAEYFSFFISQLTLSEKSLLKMHNFLPQFAPFLSNDMLFNDLVGVIQAFIDSEPGAPAKEVADDLLNKMNFLHKKSLNEEERKNFLESLSSAEIEETSKNEENAFTFDKCDQPVEYESS